MYTTEQLQAINEDGDLVISAVAGSGKTTTMIGRLVRLILSGVNPERILVLMFGKAASDDFTLRLQQEAQKHQFTPPRVMTFHAFGMKLVRAMEQQRLLPQMKLITQDFEVTKLLRETLAELNATLASEEQLDPTPELIQEFIEVIDFIKASTDMDQVEEFLASGGDMSLLSQFKREFVQGFMIFERLRYQAKVRTFSDLIFDPVCAIRAEDSIANFVGNRYDHILCDEGQDINQAQWSLLKAVAGTRAKVAIVGDEDQAIYGWRGASSKFMHQSFIRDFPGAKVLSLPHTFRYGHRLSLAANHVIANNHGRMDKMCLSLSSNTDTNIEVIMSGMDAGQPVVDAIRNSQEQNRPLSEIAILLREYSHSVSVEAALLRNNVPYRIVGAEPFFNRTEILAVRGYLQLACGLEKLESGLLRAAINAMLRVPGLFLRSDLIEHLTENIAMTPASAAEILQQCQQSLAASYGQSGFIKTRKLREAIENWRYFIRQSDTMRADAFLESMVRKLDLYAYFTRNGSKSSQSNERMSMVQQIIQTARLNRFTVRGLVDYLDNLNARYESIDRDTEHVLVTSVHRAKGLDWPHVILPELAEGKFPSIKDQAESDEIEDERRLFYVALTRAKELLTLICPKDPVLQKWSNEFKVGHPDIKSITASRFLYEGNIFGSVLVGRQLHGKDHLLMPADSPLFAKYRKKVDRKSE